MDRTTRTLVSILILILGPGLLSGCPSVDPGLLDPIFSEEATGPVLSIACHFEGDPGSDMMAVQTRILDCFDAHSVQAFDIQLEKNCYSVKKTVLNPPGLLRKLELNRFLAAFVRGCAEDQWLTFFRGDDLVKKETFRDINQWEVLGRKERVISAVNQAFNIQDEVTPLVYTFKKPALRIPLNKVHLGYQEDASRVTLTIHDRDLIAQLRKHVGWTEDRDPSFATEENYVDIITSERTLYAAVAGIILIEDVIRPGAQIVVDDVGPRWVFGGFKKGLERKWIEAMVKRTRSHSLTRYVLEILEIPEEGSEPESTAPSPRTPFPPPGP